MPSHQMHSRQQAWPGLAWPSVCLTLPPFRTHPPQTSQPIIHHPAPHLRFIEARQQRCNCRLSCAAAADKCCHGALFQHQVDITQNCRRGGDGRMIEQHNATHADATCALVNIVLPSIQPLLVLWVFLLHATWTSTHPPCHATSPNNKQQHAPSVHPYTPPHPSFPSIPSLSHLPSPCAQGKRS